MTVYVNNDEKEITFHKLSLLLDHIGLKDARGIAVAVNQNVVQRKDWAEYILNENDKITIIKATQGG